jgi:hypothetical protein
MPQVNMKPLAVCAIFRNEGPFLLEWIAYHRAVGFDFFVLYDNDSDDGGADIIRASPLAQHCAVIQWSHHPGQLAAYRDFIQNYSGNFAWVAFIDLDEFLLPLVGEGIPSLLQKWRDFSAVLVSWRIFGPAGWIEPPDGLVIENYDLRSADELPVNHHIKSIVQCADLLDVTPNPHEFAVRGAVCNTAGRAVSNIAIQPEPCHQNLVLNHYVTRSRRDWMAKIRRGSAMFANVGLAYKEELFEHFAEVSRIKDETIKTWAPAVRARLRGDSLAARHPDDPTRPAIEQTGLSVADARIVAHVQNIGDTEGRFGEWVGQPKSGRWIEGLQIVPAHDISPEQIRYQAILGDNGLSPWMHGGSFCGSRGLSLPLRGFCVQLLGTAADRYECSYSARFVDGSKVDRIVSGKMCAGATLAPLEAFRIVLHARSG